jgi:hypothetical protein
MIGFHRVYLTTRDRKYFEEDPFGNAYLGNYLGSLGMGFDAVQFIIKAGPDQITFLTAEDAKQLHINFEGSLPSQQRSTSLIPATQTPTKKMSWLRS